MKVRNFASLTAICPKRTVRPSAQAMRFSVSNSPWKLTCAVFGMYEKSVFAKSPSTSFSTAGTSFCPSARRSRWISASFGREK